MNKFIDFSVDYDKFSIYCESSTFCLDIVKLVDFCKIGEQHFHVLNEEMPFDFRLRILASTWMSTSKKVALYFFSLIRNKTKEDELIISRMSLFIPFHDIELISMIAEKDAACLAV